MRRNALWALSIICIANFFNYMDRQLVSALETPISRDLGLNDRQFGFLWTLFTLGYMICAVPIGILSDRTKRPRLFAQCILVWSVATVFSGLAPSRQALYVARIFIGVGEAGCLVVGPALISDLFEQKVRGRALSVFYLGMPLGGTAAFILSGLLLDPEQERWRHLFLLAGLPGFGIAVLVWLLPDPPRGVSEGNPHVLSSVKDYARLVKVPTLLLVILAQAFAVVILIPLIHFGTEFFIMGRGMRDRDARIAMGIIALIAGALGNVLSGVIGDWLARRTKGAYALLAGVGYLAGWPCLYVGFTALDKEIFLPALTAGCFFYFLCMPAVNTQIVNVVPAGQRGAAMALAVFVLHLLGDTASPTIFGAVCDHLTRQYAETEHAVGAALGTEILPAAGAIWARERAFSYFSISLLFASLCSFAAAFTARRDAERAAGGVRDQGSGVNQEKANGEDKPRRSL